MAMGTNIAMYIGKVAEFWGKKFHNEKEQLPQEDRIMSRTSNVPLRSQQQQACSILNDKGSLSRMTKVP